jgi:hypothetical protein
MSSELPLGAWDNMTVTQRILRCREYAKEAELLARTARPHHKLEYKRIAQQWNTLAAELETFGRSDSPQPRRAGGG